MPVSNPDDGGADPRELFHLRPRAGREGQCSRSRDLPASHEVEAGSVKFVEKMFDFRLVSLQLDRHHRTTQFYVLLA